MKFITFFAGLFSVVFKSQEVSSATSESSVESSINVLKTTMNDGEIITNFCNEYIVPQNSRNYYARPSNCADLMISGIKKSGIYTIFPRPSTNAATAMQVFCDMDIDGGGWTVIQRRAEYPERQLNFTESWTSYADGFGNLNEEFWLGNSKIHTLTTQDNVVLRIELQDFEGSRRYAHYNDIEIEDEKEQFKLRVSEYHGDAGDSFSYGNGMNFWTYDRDNKHNCVEKYRGGWWYNQCHESNLNGKYLAGTHTSDADGIEWGAWLGYHYSLKSTEMKIRPKYFTCKTDPV